MQKENFKPFIGQLIKHKHSNKKATLLDVEEGVNGGLLVRWIIDPYKISLPSCDFELLTYEDNTP